MTSWEALGLLRKVNVTSVRRRPAFLSDPVVGSEGIYVADEEADLVKIDRRTLDVAWRQRSRKFGPLREWSAHYLLVGELGDRVGMLDVEAKKLLWTKSTLHGGAEVWSGQILIQTAQGPELVEPSTGKVLRTLAVGAKPGPSILCGDVLVFRDEESGDPVRAFGLSAERVVWSRDLIAEMRIEHQIDEPEAPKRLTYVSGSSGTRFIAVRGGAVLACSLKDGRILWSARVPVTYAWPLVRDGRVHVLYGNRFIAISEETGEILYDRAYRELDGVIFPKAGAAQAGMIAMPAESGHLMVFDAADGRLVSLRKYEAPLDCAVEADGRLLVTARDGNLLIFEDGAVDIDSKPSAKKSTWKAPKQNVRYEGGMMFVEDAVEIGYETEKRLVKMEAPKVAPLSTADARDLDRLRAPIESLTKRAFGSRTKLSRTMKDVPMFQRLIDQMWIGKSMVPEQIAMGVVLGDILAKAHGLRWVMVTDEHGRTAALQNDATEGLTFPVTMIAKRYERGEKIKLEPLLREIAKVAISGGAEAAGTKAGKSLAPSKSRRGS